MRSRDDAPRYSEIRERDNGREMTARHDDTEWLGKAGVSCKASQQASDSDGCTGINSYE